MAKVNKGIQIGNEFMDAPMSISAITIEPAVSKFFTTRVLNKPAMKVILIDNATSLYNDLLMPLNKAGIVTKHVTDLSKTIPLIKSAEVECIICRPQWALENAYDFINELTAVNYTGSIIIISENKSVKELVRALEAGADAYLTIPFVAEELIARINSLYRFRRTDNTQAVIFNELKLDKPERRFYVHDKLVFLTRTEFELLLFFVENKNKVLSRQDLIFNSWHEKTNFEKYSVALYSHIKNIKKKIAANNGNDYIATIYGVGYRMNEK